MLGKQLNFRYTQGNGEGPPQRVGGEGSRKAPEGMPSSVPSQSRVPRQEARPRDVLPQQKPVTDEVMPQPPPKKWVLLAKRIGFGLLLVLALAFIYVFLLLGEPENTAVEAPPLQEEAIRVPMAAVEAPGNADLSALSASFGKPVLALYGGLSLQKATLYDTAFQGGYARRATLTYAFEDGQVLLLDSLRPTGAVTLLGGGQATLVLDNLYAIAGIDATRMDTEKTICVFGKNEEAVYAVTCPVSHAADLAVLLKQTTLMQP